MFRLLRITALIALIAYHSPLRGTDGGAAAPADSGIGSLAGFTELLTASWKGAGNMSALLEARAMQEAAATALLRRGFDPDTTASIAPRVVFEGSRPVAPLFPPR